MANSAPGAKGLDLEEALKAYFSDAGYFVTRSVPYRLDDDEITDIDLWLYERPAALTRRRLIVDVKNRRSPKASERIIWSKGLQAALGTDGVIVATTDKRTSARRLARRLNVILLDGEAVSQLMQADRPDARDQLRHEELVALVKKVDESRRTTDWRQAFHDARASLVSWFGVQSTNINLRAVVFFAAQATLAHPRSEAASLALRLTYLSTALAAISLDFISADQVFMSADDRRQATISGIRFGQSESSPALSTIRAAIGLARQYAENGAAFAKNIEHKFFGDAERIPAEIIADYVARPSVTDSLFSVARELERASLATNLPGYDTLTVEARSLLGVSLDFSDVSRERFAGAWPKQTTDTHPQSTGDDPAKSTGPLFDSPS